MKQDETFEILDSFDLPYCEEGEFTGFQVNLVYDGAEAGRSPQPEVGICFFRDGDCAEGIGLYAETVDELIAFLTRARKSLGTGIPAADKERDRGMIMTIKKVIQV